MSHVRIDCNVISITYAVLNTQQDLHTNVNKKFKAMFDPIIKSSCVGASSMGIAVLHTIKENLPIIG